MTVNGVPLAGIVAGVQDQVPFGCTVVVHATLPLGSLTLTVAPGSPRPKIGLPFVGFTVGADGDVVVALLTMVVDGDDVVSPGSVAVAVMTVFGARGAARLHTNLPFASAMTGALVHVAPVILTVAPGVAVPVITRSRELTGFRLGALL